MPPLPANREHEILKPAAERLGLHPFDIPMLRNTVPYNGRGACMRCRWCVGFACEVDAKCGTHNTVIPKALATGNCELRTECVVKEILTDDHGRATGVAYFDARGRLQEQTADLVVVSASATESARLLLNSKSRLFPNGLGNRYDWVGRNLQGHAYAGAAGLFDKTPTTTLAPAPPSPSAITTTAIPAWWAAACCPTNSSACPISSPPCVRPECRAGAPRTRTSCASLTGAPSRSWARAGDAGLRVARAGGPQGEGLLGNPGGAPLRRRHPQTIDVGRITFRRRRQLG